MTRHRLIACSTTLALVLIAGPTLAQITTQETEIAASEPAGTEMASTARGSSRLDASDRLSARIWGLSDEEMQRAKVLMQGPRKAFSVENLSPIEVLGIHARNEGERTKYAEKFARALHEDVQRSLAWNDAFTEAMQRLYPGEPVVSYEGVEPVRVPTGSADLAGVPRSLVVDSGASVAPQGRTIAVEPRQ